MEAATQTSENIAILPSPGMGHLIPLLEFAKRLVHQHNFSITFIIPTDGPPSKPINSLLDSVPASINSVFLPPVDITDLGEETKIETRISLTVTRSISALRDLFNSLVNTKKTPPVALVVDLFGTDAFDVATEFKISPYIFYPTNANCLSFFFHLPKLDQTVQCEYRELPDPVNIPGWVVPIPGQDLLDPVQDRTNEAYRWVLHQAKKYKLAKGIIINTFMDLESEAIKYLQIPGPDKPLIYPVGPLVKPGSNSNDENPILKWLDDQPDGSVMFVSFGSGGTLSREQFTELAFGLEMSEHRFLWVVRSPNDTSDSSYFDSESKNDPFRFLPEGFLNRTKNSGLVVPSWAPQVDILGHGATGGFLTHCGWNSALESIVNGVPLLVWPLYAEQKMNAKILTEVKKIGLRVRANEKGIVGRSEIARVVKSLMEGEDGKFVRSRIKDLKEVAKKVIGEEDGSSSKALSELALKWKMKE